MSHCSVTPEGKRKREEEDPRRMVGTPLVPWSGLRDFTVLGQGLSGKEEDLGSQKTTELALRAGRDPWRSPSPGRLPWQAHLPTYPGLCVLHLSSHLLCLTLNQQCCLRALACAANSAWIPLAGQILTCLLVLSLDAASLGKSFLYPSLSTPC